MAPMILSLFPGIDLFGRGFEAEGACVVRGPDLLWGGNIESFSTSSGIFTGIIGGSPCQDFSRARRTAPTGQGVHLLEQFARVVTEAGPDWWILENVPQVPDVNVEGYHIQRFNLSARECGLRQNRLRRFQFGSRDGAPLVIHRCDTVRGASQRCCMATEFSKAKRRSFADFCEAQGLPRDFDLPGLSLAAKYLAVGNGVPIPMARVVAIAVLRRRVTPGCRLCVCECGRPVSGQATHATAGCRKRMERRRRDFAGVSGPGRVTAFESHAHAAL